MRYLSQVHLSFFSSCTGFHSSSGFLAIRDRAMSCPKWQCLNVCVTRRNLRYQAVSHLKIRAALCVMWLFAHTDPDTKAWCNHASTFKILLPDSKHVIDISYLYRSLFCLHCLFVLMWAAENMYVCNSSSISFFKQNPAEVCRFLFYISPMAKKMLITLH